MGGLSAFVFREWAASFPSNHLLPSRFIGLLCRMYRQMDVDKSLQKSRVDL
jgi:hypothetical protein